MSLDDRLRGHLNAASKRPVRPGSLAAVHRRSHQRTQRHRIAAGSAMAVVLGGVATLGVVALRARPDNLGDFAAAASTTVVAPTSAVEAQPEPLDTPVTTAIPDNTAVAAPGETTPDTAVVSTGDSEAIAADTTPDHDHVSWTPLLDGAPVDRVLTGGDMVAIVAGGVWREQVGSEWAPSPEIDAVAAAGDVVAMSRHGGELVGLVLTADVGCGSELSLVTGSEVSDSPVPLRPLGRRALAIGGASVHSGPAFTTAAAVVEHQFDARCLALDLGFAVSPDTQVNLVDGNTLAISPSDPDGEIETVLLADHELGDDEIAELIADPASVRMLLARPNGEGAWRRQSVGPPVEALGTFAGQPIAVVREQGVRLLQLGADLSWGDLVLPISGAQGAALSDGGVAIWGGSTISYAMAGPGTWWESVQVPGVESIHHVSIGAGGPMAIVRALPAIEESEGTDVDPVTSIARLDDGEWHFRPISSFSDLGAEGWAILGGNRPVLLQRSPAGHSLFEPVLQADSVE